MVEWERVRNTASSLYILPRIQGWYKGPMTVHYPIYKTPPGLYNLGTDTYPRKSGVYTREKLTAREILRVGSEIAAIFTSATTDLSQSLICILDV